MIPIKLLHDRVLVSEEAEGERQSSGGILIPATASVGKRLLRNFIHLTDNWEQ